MPVSLHEWESFYVITGSSGAALTGLMFVVIALAADRMPNTPHDALGAFSTPTIAHFAIVLLLASIMTMPLHSVTSLSICLGASALIGLAFAVRAGVRMKRLEVYDAVAEDWAFNVIVPFAAYLVLLVSALLLGRAQERVLFVVGATVLLLLFLGIRNAWDVAVFLVTTRPAADSTPATANSAPTPPSAKTKRKSRSSRHG